MWLCRGDPVSDKPCITSTSQALANYLEALALEMYLRQYSSSILDVFRLRD